MRSIHVIAEAGINHNGAVSTALELMKVAKEAGCDSVKFQKRTPEICVPDNQKGKLRETPWGEITYLEYKEKIEFGIEEYQKIDSYSKSIGIEWSASAWDIPSLEFLDQFDLPYHKVASALATHKVFLKEVALRGKPVILSIGMTTMKEIEEAVSIFKASDCDITLMHTVSNYPAQEKDLNLRMIQTYKDKFGISVGYSGHETAVSPSIVAAALGAEVIERHITLDRSMWGTDHSASLEPAALSRLVSSIRKVPVVLGDGIKREIGGEAEVAKKMRYWEA